MDEFRAVPILRSDEPAMCIDETSSQLIGHSREPLPMAPGAAAKQDCDHVRKGTTNLFVAAEPKAPQRVVSVTAQRGRGNFAGFVQTPLTRTYAKAQRVHPVLDNLNIHSGKSFDDVPGCRAVGKLRRSVDARQARRNAQGHTIEWKLTRQDADRKLRRRDVSKFTG